MTKEALKLALEALEEWLPTVPVLIEKKKSAITAIKEALAQPEQEPVTWRYKIVDVFGRPAWTLKTPKSDTRVLESQPLYTTPPQRTWVGLTLDERIELAKDVDWPVGAYCEYAEKIEAKLKEKNELR